MSAEVVHRLGAVAGAALVIAWLARWTTAVRHERRVRWRLGELLAAAQTTAEGPRFQARDLVRRWLPVVGVGCAGWVLVGGVLEGVGMWWAMRIVRGAETA